LAASSKRKGSDAVKMNRQAFEKGWGFLT
ncbi:hypothetical protein LCGC14_2222450, partial [marine sediment metagenome]